MQSFASYIRSNVATNCFLLAKLSKLLCLKHLINIFLWCNVTLILARNRGPWGAVDPRAWSLWLRRILLFLACVVLISVEMGSLLCSSREIYQWVLLNLIKQVLWYSINLHAYVPIISLFRDALTYYLESNGYRVWGPVGTHEFYRIYIEISQGSI